MHSSKKRYRVRKSGPLRGTVRVPGDKSIGHRSLIFGALGRGVSRVTGLSEGLDNAATRQAFRSMGVGVETHDGTTEVRGVRPPRPTNAERRRRLRKLRHHHAFARRAFERPAFRNANGRRRVADPPADGARDSSASSSPARTSRARQAQIRTISTHRFRSHPWSRARPCKASSTLCPWRARR